MSVRIGKPYPKGAKHKWVQRWEVDSDGLGEPYTVAVDLAGKLGCSCTGWKMSKKDEATGNKPNCKHIRELIEYLATPADPHLRPLGEPVGPVPVYVDTKGGKLYRLPSGGFYRQLPPAPVQQNFADPHVAINQKIASVAMLLSELREAIEQGDYAGAGRLRKDLEAHRSLTSIATEQIDAAFKQVDQMVVNKFTE